MADITINFPASGGLLSGSIVEVTMPIVVVCASGSATLAPFLYVCDSGNNRIQAFDYYGNPLFEWGAGGTGDGEFVTPYGVTNDGERVYVTDTGNNRVQYFDLYGNYLGEWGSYGNLPGEFSSPKGIAANDRYVFVIDQGNDRFQIFTSSGELVMIVGEHGSGENQFNAPTNCYVDEYYLYIDDTGNNRIVAYLLNFIGDYGWVVLPAITINAHGGWPSGRGSVVLPAIRLSTVGATGGVSRVGSGDIVLPAVTVSANGYLWHVGLGNVILPAISIRGNGIFSNAGIGSVVLPVVTVSANGYAWHLGTGSVILPAIILTANGYVVLTNPEFFGISMNMRNKVISTYLGYNFNSMAVLDGHVYGANEYGIYLLEGADDNGVDIDAHIKTGTFDLHDPRVQRLVDAWLSLRISGSGVFTVYEDEETEGTTEDIIVEDPNMHDERVGLPQGLKGRFVAFKFENVDGSDFDITGLSVRTRELRRLR